MSHNHVASQEKPTTKHQTCEIIVKMQDSRTQLSIKHTLNLNVDEKKKEMKKKKEAHSPHLIFIAPGAKRSACFMNSRQWNHVLEAKVCVFTSIRCPDHYDHIDIYSWDTQTHSVCAYDQKPRYWRPMLMQSVLQELKWFLVSDKQTFKRKHFPLLANYDL